MTKKEKGLIVNGLVNKFANSHSFYVVNPGGLRVRQVDMVRRTCFQKNVEYKVAKNTLLFKALVEAFGGGLTGFDPLSVLKGSSGVFFVNEGESVSFPARFIKSVSKGDGAFSILLKCAVVDKDVYVGHEHLDFLSALKSKNEMVGEVVALLKGSLSTVLASLENRF